MMKRMWRIKSEASQSELSFLYRTSTTKPTKNLPDYSSCPLSSILARFSAQRSYFAQTNPCPNSFANIVGFFADKCNYLDFEAREELSTEVEQLRDELLIVNANATDSEEIVRVLEGKGVSLFRSYSDGSAFVELLKQLRYSPLLAMEVFNWRRKQAEFIIPLTTEEYAKGITVAGRMRDVNLALEIFTEAANMRLKTTSTYNALMGAYMFNGLAEKCQSLFRDLKRDGNCTPTIVSYNILISVFGRLMLVDHMEATFHELGCGIVWKQHFELWKQAM